MKDDNLYNQQILDIKSSYSIEVDAANVIHLTFLKALSSDQENIKQTVLITQEIEDIFTSRQGSIFTALVDVTQIGAEHIRELPSESKQLYRKLSTSKQLHKIAVVAQEEKQDHVLSLVQWLSKLMTKLAWFSDVNEAIMWLKKFSK